MGIGAAYAGVVWLLSNEGMKSKPGKKISQMLTLIIYR